MATVSSALASKRIGRQVEGMRTTTALHRIRTPRATNNNHRGSSMFAVLRYRSIYSPDSLGSHADHPLLVRSHTYNGTQWKSPQGRRSFSGSPDCMCCEKKNGQVRGRATKRTSNSGLEPGCCLSTYLSGNVRSDCIRARCSSQSEELCFAVIGYTHHRTHRYCWYLCCRIN